MTSTTSTTDTLDLTRDALTLVVVSPDYFATGEQHHRMPNRDDESRTYYATASRLMGADWATLIVGWDTDPRGHIGWRVGDDYADLVGPNHGGWNIRRQYLTPVTTTTDDRTPPTSAAMSQHDRVALPIEEAYPVGSRWTHVPSGVTCTVTGHSNDTVYLTRDDGVPSSGWLRWTFDQHCSFLGWEGEASHEATSAPETAEETAPEVFTREDVDRLVREAREAARREASQALEEFKETANARAVEYAESNGLCSEFERCMADIGLMGREEWREAHLTDYSVEFIVTVNVSASDEDDAEERAREELYESLSYPLDQNIYHHSTQEM